MSLKIEDHICTKVFPDAVIPNTSFTCDDKMIRATALVKPLLTGPETKSIRKPRPKTPIKISIIPVRNESKTALCQTPPAAWNVRMEAMAVGPMGTSLQEPRKMYTKQPRKEPYKPYWRWKRNESYLENTLIPSNELTAAGRPAIPL